jgi:hypothetical protein
VGTVIDGASGSVIGALAAIKLLMVLRKWLVKSVVRVRRSDIVLSTVSFATVSVTP